MEENGTNRGQPNSWHAEEDKQQVERLEMD
jgi:hypothetical protein